MDSSLGGNRKKNSVRLTNSGPADGASNNNGCLARSYGVLGSLELTDASRNLELTHLAV